MDGLNNLTMATKSILLKSYVALFVLLNFAFITVVYLKVRPIPPSSVTYQLNLDKFVQEYSSQREQFESYSFYENYDTLIYNNSIFNTDYQESVNQFSNLTQKEFYKFYDIVKRISAKKNFGEIAKYGYDYNDWARKDALIRDEKGYNSSFIFAALTAIEYKLNKGLTDRWIALSAQEIIDCCEECLVSRKPESVFDYIKKNGVTEEEVYSYEMSRFDTVPKKCRKQEKGGKRYTIAGYRSAKNCQAL